MQVTMTTQLNPVAYSCLGDCPLRARNGNKTIRVVKQMQCLVIVEFKTFCHSEAVVVMHHCFHTFGSVIHVYLYE